MSGNEDVISVSDRNDPGQLGYLVTAEAPGVALAIDPLVMGEDYLGDRPVAVEGGDDPCTLLGVTLDQLPIALREWLVGLEDPVGEDELADVMQESGKLNQILIALGEPCRFAIRNE